MPISNTWSSRAELTDNGGVGITDVREKNPDPFKILDVKCYSCAETGFTHLKAQPDSNGLIGTKFRSRTPVTVQEFSRNELARFSRIGGKAGLGRVMAKARPQIGLDHIPHRTNALDLSLFQ